MIFDYDYPWEGSILEDPPAKAGSKIQVMGDMSKPITNGDVVEVERGDGVLTLSIYVDERQIGARDLKHHMLTQGDVAVKLVDDEQRDLA